MILYQFKKFDENGNTLENISKRKIWLSSPYKFNDPFDTIIRISCEYDKEIFYFCTDIYNENVSNYEKISYTDCLFLFPSDEGSEGDSPYPSFTESINFVLMRFPELKKNLLAKIKERFGDECIAVTSFIESFSRIGISCFSSAWYEPIMWAHYADNHRGLCIKYEIDMSLFCSSLHLIPVAYNDKLPDCSYAHMGSVLRISNIEKHIGNKSAPWSYEHEYRIVCENICDESIPIPGKIISICTGLRANEENKKDLFKAIGKKSDIFLGQVSKSVSYRKLDWSCALPSSGKLDLMFYTSDMES